MTDEERGADPSTIAKTLPRHKQAMGRDKNVFHPPTVILQYSLNFLGAVGLQASLSAAFFRLVGSSLKEYTGKGEADGPQGMSIFPKFNDILTSGAMSATINNTKPEVDGSSIIAKFISVRAASKTFDVSSRGIVTENCSFVAIKQMDESETEV